MSKRCFDGLVKQWRKLLHTYDAGVVASDSGEASSGPSNVDAPVNPTSSEPRTPTTDTSVESVDSDFSAPFRTRGSPDERLIDGRERGATDNTSAAVVAAPSAMFEDDDLL